MRKISIMLQLTSVGRLRRSMLLLSIVTCITTAILFCCQRREKSTKHNTKQMKQETSPQWTWHCYDGRCEQMLATDMVSPQSLFTCNMLCSSTQLWPQPTGHIKLSKNTVHVRTNEFSARIVASPNNKVSQCLLGAFNLFKDNLHMLESRTGNNERNKNEGMHSVIIQFVIEAVDGSGDSHLLLSTDESYNLSIKSSYSEVNHKTSKTVINISANSFFGARHGLETLSQLIWWDPYAKSLLMIKIASIEDAPKFKYRGLLLDTARNYIPVRDIKRTIDAMAASKLNTYWHATDSQSFPLKLNNAPQFAEHGAYGRDQVYTTQDIKGIVEHARLRGVRVLIEVDTPAHVGRAWSWGPNAGVGHLAICAEAQPWRKYCKEPPCGQLNPQNPHIYKLLALIYAEIMELTGINDVFHIGGNKISKFCWSQHLNHSDPMELWHEFTLNALKSLERANDGKIPELTLIWSSSLTRRPFLKRLNKTILSIEIRSSSRSPKSRIILDKGFRSVLSHVDAWNLDCGFGSWRESTNKQCKYNSWQKIYEHRPWAKKLQWNIEGGEACQWTEQLGPEGLDASIWPRAAALAERLWSDREEIAVGDVYLRLDTHRTRLIARGVRAQPLWPWWCSQNPYSCFKLGETIEEIEVS